MSYHSSGFSRRTAPSSRRVRILRIHRFLSFSALEFQGEAEEDGSRILPAALRFGGFLKVRDNDCTLVRTAIEENRRCFRVGSGVLVTLR